jgi:polysaccharide biosynthesis protein PslG
MLAAGLQPEIVVFTAPCWARPSTSCSNSADTGPPDSQYDSDWEQFVEDVAARYPKALAIEAWNEPNLNQYWLPLANPSRYEQILQETYTAVKSVDPSMPVIAGGLLLAPIVSENTLLLGGEGDTEFLTTMLTLGAGKYMDGLAIHIYPSDYLGLTPETWDPNAMTTWIGNVQTVLNLQGRSNEPLYITEMGVSTATESGWAAAATDQQQATDLVDMVHIAQDTPNVKLVTIHTLEDEAADPGDPNESIDEGWGVFTSTGSPKPSACALAPVIGGTLKCTS